MLSAFVDLFQLVSMPTLALVMPIIWALNCVLLVSIWRINRDQPGPGWWAAGAITTVIGFLFAPDTLAVFGWPRSVGYALNNIASMVGAMCGLQGALSFRQRRTLPWWSWLALLPSSAGVLWFQTHPTLRYVFMDPCLIALLLGTAWVLVRHAPSGLRPYVKVAASFLALAAVALGGRLFLAATLPTGVEVVAQPYQKFLFLVLIGYAIGWNHSVGMLCYARASERLTTLAKEDALTGLPNRRHLDEYIRREINRCQRSGERFALIMLDLNGFKSINDRYGHPAGDLVLQTTAQRLQQTLRDSDFAARIGGDEFVVVVHDVQSDEQVQHTLGRLHDGVDGPVTRDGGMTIRASMGHAVWPQDGVSADVLWATADRRMYTDKQARKPRPVTGTQVA